MKTMYTVKPLEHVLIILADKALQQSLAKWLTSKAKLIKLCDNFKTASLMIKNCRFDLIISDYKINNNVVIELQPKEYPNTNFMVISSSCSPEDAFLLARSGIQWFYPLSMELKDFQTRVEEFCSTKAAVEFINIRTFGGLRITRGGLDLTFSRKAPHRLLSILKLMVALGGVNVPIYLICDTIWEDDDGDTALSKFYTSIHRIRKLLGKETIELKNQEVSFNTTLVELDVWRLQQYRAEKLTASEEDKALYSNRWLPEDDSVWLNTYRQIYEAQALTIIDSHQKLKVHG